MKSRTQILMVKITNGETAIKLLLMMIRGRDKQTETERGDSCVSETDRQQRTTDS